MIKLNRNFFNRDTIEVAKELLGKIIVFNNFQVEIIETEAYKGIGDEASHSFRGITKRTEVMFGPPGFSYVYLIYGIHHCLNFITENIGVGAGVLIRGIKTINDPSVTFNGPGKLCKYLGISKLHNNIDITTSNNFYIIDINNRPKYLATPRIGITKSVEKPWRFIIK